MSALKWVIGGFAALWDWCQGEEAKDVVRATACVSYIVGANETFEALHVANQVTYYCTPEKTQNGQVINVVKLYLRDHPETRQYSAPTLIMLAPRKNSPAISCVVGGLPAKGATEMKYETPLSLEHRKLLPDRRRSHGQAQNCNGRL